MSHKTQGTILRTPSGKFIRTYRTASHVGFREFVQETPDIACATVFHGGFAERKLRERIGTEIPSCTELLVEITRTVEILQEGPQPTLPWTN